MEPDSSPSEQKEGRGTATRPVSDHFNAFPREQQAVMCFMAVLGNVSMNRIWTGCSFCSFFPLERAEACDPSEPPPPHQYQLKLFFRSRSQPDEDSH